MRVEIDGESIRLGQLLKLAGLVGSGGEARLVLDTEPVTVDGRPETRRGAQIRPGSVVEALGERVEVVARA